MSKKAALKNTRTCTFVRQLETGAWVRCIRDRDGKHSHPESQAGLRKAVAAGRHYRFV